MAMERVTVGRLVSRTFETVIGSGQAAAIYVVVLAFGDSLAEYLLALGGDQI